MESFPLQLVLNYLAVLLIQKLKEWKTFPWLADGAAVANRVAAAIAAVAAMVGVSFVYDATAGSLLITGLSFTVIVKAAVELGLNWIVQKLLYRVTVKPAVPVPVTP